MKSKAEVETLLDDAEREIKAVLSKYGAYISTLYPDDSITLTIGHQEPHPNGDIRVTERETDI